MAENLAVRGVVINYQNSEVLQPWQTWLRNGARRNLLAEFGGEPESRALSFLARDPDFSTHQFDQLLRNGQTQTRPAILACRRAVSLCERLEEKPLRGLGDTDTRIANREAKNNLIVSFTF